MFSYKIKINVLLQEVWDDKDVTRIKEVLGDDFYLTDHYEFSPKCMDRKKRETFVKSGRRMSIPMFRCSGLLIASKHKTKVFSDFMEFEEYGSFWKLDCISISQPEVSYKPHCLNNVVLYYYTVTNPITAMGVANTKVTRKFQVTSYVLF